MHVLFLHKEGIFFSSYTRVGATTTTATTIFVVLLIQRRRVIKIIIVKEREHSHSEIAKANLAEWLGHAEK